MIKCLKLTGCWSALMILLLIITPFQVKAQLAKGADIGWLSQFESWGVEYQNDQGVIQDAIQILKDHGTNSIRLRAWVDPSPDGMVNGYPGGFCDTQSVVAMAKRASDLGMRIMITVHYSDEWADPNDQHIPSAWVGLSHNQLVTAVYDYTVSLMTALQTENITPEWVQVGNETDYGMLGTMGALVTNDPAQMTRMVELYNSGYDAVKSVFPTTEVIVHLSTGNDNWRYRNFFDAYTAYNGKVDVIGMSYYPHWHGGSIGHVQSNMNDMIATYNKDVMLVEIGHYETEPQATYDVVLEAVQMVQSIPNNRGLGVFWWEPEGTNALTGGYPLSAAAKVNPSNNNMVHRFTMAIDAFEAVCTSITLTPYSQVNSEAWSSAVDVSVSSGDQVKFGPHPTTGGSWSWSGPNNFSANSREVIISNIQAINGGTYTATYTNYCGANSTLDFSILVDGGCAPTPIVPYFQINGGNWTSDYLIDAAVGDQVVIGPQPVSGGSWTWSGPDGYTATWREIWLTDIQANQAGNYTAYYTTDCGATSDYTFVVNVAANSQEIIMRARGTNGGENINLLVDGSTVASFTLSTSMQNYSYNTSASGTVSVEFDNDASGLDVQLDYIQLGGVTYQAEDQASNTGVWQGNSCGGSYSEWMNCNGTITFSSANARLAKANPSENNLTDKHSVQIYPNPVSNGQLTLSGIRENTKIQILSLSGQKLFESELNKGANQLSLPPLKSGTYLIQLKEDTGISVQKLRIE